MGLRPLKNLCEVAVIGGGLAGLAAARHAVRLGHLVTLFEGSGLYGGQVATVDHVDGLPIPGSFSGQQLAIPMLDEAKKVGMRLFETSVVRLATGDRLVLTDSDGEDHHPEAVIVATGGALRKLGVPGEDAFAGRGISHCASCDGGFYRGKTVAVIGGGDAAVHEALVLARVCAEVVMVCRSPLRAKREYADKLDARENVRFLWDTEVFAVTGDSSVSGLRLRNVRDGSESELACAGVFPFIGVEPQAGFLPPALLDTAGLVQAQAGYASADPRVMAAGAARAGFGGTAAQAMAEGIGAAAAAHQFLTRKGRVQ